MSADYGEKAPFKATNRNRKNKNQHGRRRDCDATDRLWLQVHSNTLFTCSTISRYSGKGSRPLSTSPRSHPTLQLRTDAPDDLLDRPMSYTFNERAVVAGRLRNCLRTPATARPRRAETEMERWPPARNNGNYLSSLLMLIRDAASIVRM